MASQGSSSKGNGASKRMSNPNHKATRARSWAKGETRKKARVEAQKQREAENKKLRAAGQPTPWEQARAARAERRRHLQKAA
jgi:hypothetical protein